MPLVNAKDLLKHALQNNYAVGYFESWNLESTLAVVRAAEIARSPVMIGFCGAYLNNPERKHKEDLSLYSTFLRKIGNGASIPVATLLNETTEINMVYSAIKNGFEMVMFVDDEMPVDKLTQVQKKIVEFAHACEVTVEAEVGTLPTCQHSTGQLTLAQNTDPEIASKFVKETGVDALAVSIGNVHLLEGMKAELDFNLLEKLHKNIDIPLVLHGGTGIDKSDFKEAISLGVAKVNVGAGLKRVFINAQKEYLAKNDIDKMNPNDIYGKGGKFDIEMHAHDAMIDYVLEFIKAFNGENKSYV